MVDIVLTYVNGNDPLWREEFAKATGVAAVEKRYRDWGTLNYLFRAIRKNLPFAGTIYLVVSGESQVPQWVDRSKVKVVFHRDIIPEEYLPVFNSTAIEMFLHRIPGLSENYIYFNDDIFPLLPCVEEDFFRGGKSVLGFRRHLVAAGLYRSQTRNADVLARKALGRRPGLGYIRPQHTNTPHQKSACEAVWKAIGADLEASISPLREKMNVNQYVFLDYLYHSGRTVRGAEISNRHLSLAVKSDDEVVAKILSPDRKLVCINDVRLDEDRFTALRARMLEAFESRFPEKCEEEL